MSNSSKGPLAIALTIGFAGAAFVVAAAALAPQKSFEPVTISLSTERPQSRMRNKPFGLASIAPERAARPDFPAPTGSRTALPGGAPEWFSQPLQDMPAAVSELPAGSARFGHAIGFDAAKSKSLARLFELSQARKAAVPLQVAGAQPAPERFAARPVSDEASARVALAGVSD